MTRTAGALAPAVTRNGSKLIGHSTTSLTENQTRTWTFGKGLSLRYSSVPGLPYRMHGGSDPRQLGPVSDWGDGQGMEGEFMADNTVTGGADQLFLRLEVGQP